MIDLDLTLHKMLDDIGWPHVRIVPAAWIDDHDLWGREESHLSISWRPAEYDILTRLSELYLERFPSVSFPDLHDNLIRCLQSGIDNIIRWSHGGDLNRVIGLNQYLSPTGIVVSLTASGNGFDVQRALLLFRQGADCAEGGGGFSRFAKRKVAVTYTDSGRTLLLRYRLEPADRQHVGNAGRTSRVQRTLALLGTLYPTKRSTKRLAWLARFGPDFLESRWVEPAFVERYITSSLAEAGYAESFDRNWTSTLLRLRKGTVTIRYQTGSTAIFAKFFRDAESGLRAHGALAALWRAGFRTGEPHRVPEPFAYAPAHRLLLMGGAEGTDVRNALGRRTSDPARIGRQAARWLVKLHSTALTGDCTDARNAVARDIQVVLRTSAQVWREHSPVAARILALAGDWAERRARGDVVTNVHGDFKPEHVFVTDNSTTVIDLDQMLVAHPAADVATFLWRLRSNLWRDGPSAQAVALARAFLEEYASCLPGHLDTLPFYWGLETLASLERSTAGLAAGPVFDSCVAFHLNEFDRSRKLLLEFESRDR